MSLEWLQIHRWARIYQTAVSKIRLQSATEIAPCSVEVGVSVTAEVLIDQVARDVHTAQQQGWSPEQFSQWFMDCTRARWLLVGTVVFDEHSIPRLTPLTRAGKMFGWTKQEHAAAREEALAALERVLNSQVVPDDISRLLPKLRDPKLKKRTQDFLRDAWIGAAVLTRIKNGKPVGEAIDEVADCAKIGDEAVKKIWLRHKRLLYVPKGLITRRRRRKEEKASR